MKPTDQQRLAVRERPSQQPVMHQRWQDLLFLHWVIDPERIQAKLPKGLTVDCFDGQAYLGVVPFFMRNIRFRGTPAVPWVSNFLELNLRTYVFDEAGNPGVYFFSCDCNQPLAVWIARTFFYLPYEHASITAHVSNDSRVSYQSTRSLLTRGGTSSQFEWTMDSKRFEAEPGTLDFFLIERYLLFSMTRQGRLQTGQVHHCPYPLNRVSVEHCESDLFELNGFPPVDQPFVHAIGTRGVDVEVFPLADTMQVGR
jgi:uncharacterized protein YqjF (DUF2071 family)